MEGALPPLVSKCSYYWYGQIQSTAPAQIPTWTKLPPSPPSLALSARSCSSLYNYTLNKVFHLYKSSYSTFRAQQHLFDYTHLQWNKWMWLIRRIFVHNHTSPMMKNELSTLLLLSFSNFCLFVYMTFPFFWFPYLTSFFTTWLSNMIMIMEKWNNLVNTSLVEVGKKNFHP